MSGRTEVLVVGHDASRTGAPMAALRWLRWASDTGSVDAAVWLERGGPLLPAFAAAAPTKVATGVRQRVAREALARRGGAPWVERAAGRLAPATHPFGRSPVVVANTVAAWARAAATRDRSRLVVWVHELDHVADRIVARAERDRLLAATDHLLAEGDRVATMLVARWRVPSGVVSTVPSFADAPPSDAAPGPGHHVVAVGSLTPRKGPDAFVAAVAELRRRRPDLRAAWVGGPTGSPTAALVEHDIAAADLGGAVELVGEVDDASPWLPAAGVLLHAAREDPDPIAVVEAALRGVPVVTWDTGGAADLLRRAGLDHLVAAPGDVLGLAERVEALLADPSARADAGAALRRAAAARTTEASAPALLAAIIGGAP